MNEKNLAWIEFTILQKQNYKLRIENQISDAASHFSVLLMLLKGSKIDKRISCF